jgi:hypothetical protein
VVIWPSQVLEVAVIGKQVGLVLVDDKVSVVFERIADGKIRVTTNS